MAGNALTVTQLNQYIKSLIDGNQFLSCVCVQGELSNFKLYPSGHLYFSIKDDSGTLKCVMFKSYADRLGFKPENGQKVILQGRVSVFEKGGTYQYYATSMDLDGIGKLYVEFERLKRELGERGLFLDSHKKPLPETPETIGVITSSAGAALHDIIRVLRHRWPMAAVKLMAVRVQGKEAPLEISRAIDYASRWYIADVLIVGRGGGSMEDLWAFNDPRIAYSIYNCRIPVISAVGHEPDFTIADFVADKRAATPSNGAELAVPDWRDKKELLDNLTSRANAALQKALTACSTRLDRCLNTRIMKDPQTVLIYERSTTIDYLTQKAIYAVNTAIAVKRQRLDKLTAAKVMQDVSASITVKQRQIDGLENRAVRSFNDQMTVKSRCLQQMTTRLTQQDPQRRLEAEQQKLQGLNMQVNNVASNQVAKMQHQLGVLLGKLDTLNPLNILLRGYAMVYDKHRNVITSVQGLNDGDKFTVVFADGEVDCTISRIRKDNKNE